MLRLRGQRLKAEQLNIEPVHPAEVRGEPVPDGEAGAAGPFSCTTCHEEFDGSKVYQVHGLTLCMPCWFGIAEAFAVSFPDLVVITGQPHELVQITR